MMMQINVITVNNCTDCFILNSFIVICTICMYADKSLFVCEVGIFMINSVLDIQRLLRRYGIIVYTGKRVNDLAWMEEELKELYRANLLNAQDFQRALLILQKEKGSFME